MPCCRVCKTPETPHRPFQDGICPDPFCRRGDKTPRPDESRCLAEMDGLMERYGGFEILIRVLGNQLNLARTQFTRPVARLWAEKTGTSLRDASFDVPLKMRKGWETRILPRHKRTLLLDEPHHQE